MNGIKIFGENFINSDNTYAFLSGSTSEAYLYDQKRATAWLSSGSNNATEEYIEVTFKNWQGAAVERTFDRIIILGHNLKAAQCQYWDGAAWDDITEGVLSDNEATDNLFEIVTPITSYKFKIKMTTTQVGNAEKYLGELKVCLKVLEPYWLSDYPMAGVQKAGNYRNSSGSLVSWKEYTKQAGIFSVTNVLKADMDTLMPYLESASFITIIFYNDFDLKHTYEFAIVNAPNFNLNRKTNRSSLYLDLQER